MKLLLDENFNNNILRGLLQRKADLDLVRAQDVPEITGEDDPTLLAWAADHDYVLCTHDVRTITRYAYERLEAGLYMPGVFEVKRRAPISKVVDDILLFVEAGNAEDIEGKIIYLPMS